MKNLKIILCVNSLVLLLLLTYCKEKAVEPKDEGGVGIIVPGKSIEGVNLGDSWEVVEQKIGNPTMGGIADGNYRSWIAANYMEGPHAGLSIYYINNSYDSRGPVDLITASAPYSGKTKEGIEIGSSLNNVRKAYGNPKNTLLFPDRGSIFDYYCFYGKMLLIHYKDSTATGISIGYFIPMEQDTLSSCD